MLIGTALCQRTRDSGVGRGCLSIWNLLPENMHHDSQDRMVFMLAVLRSNGPAWLDVAVEIVIVGRALGSGRR